MKAISFNVALRRILYVVCVVWDRENCNIQQRYIV
jgi:hypothetical protein